MGGRADELRLEIENAPRHALPGATAKLWRAYSDGAISEAEAEALSAWIETRLARNGSRPPGQTPNSTGTDATSVTNGPQGRQNSPRKPGVGSRPRTDASMERRRRWAASGRLPPQLAARFTLGEQAVLSVVAVEVVKRGSCTLTVGHIAAVAGVSETTVRRAVRQARLLVLVQVDERRLARFRNDTNVVTIVSAAWIGWLRLGRRGDPGGGCQTRQGTNTQGLDSASKRPAAPRFGLSEGASWTRRGRSAGGG